MPTYEFLCDNCGRKKTKIKSISKRDEVEKCKCNEIMTRLVGLGKTLIFKGKGFYCNRDKEK